MKEVTEPVRHADAARVPASCASVERFRPGASDGSLDGGAVRHVLRLVGRGGDARIVHRHARECCRAGSRARPLSRLRMHDLPSRRDRDQPRFPTSSDGPSTSSSQVIQAYRDKQLPNPVMQNIAGRLKDDEIEALARLFRNDTKTMSQETSVHDQADTPHVSPRSPGLPAPQSPACRCSRRARSARRKPKLVVIGGGPGGGTRRALRQQGYGRRDRRDADRAAAEVHHLLLLQHLCRRLPRLQVDHPQLRQGARRRREGRARDGRARSTATRREVVLAERPARSLRPPGGRARHRHQVRLRAGLFGSRRRDDAARLEARRADRAPGDASSTRSRTATPS